MVRHSQLSERSFKRRFKAATGYTPLDYVQTLRIEEATGRKALHPIVLLHRAYGGDEA